MLHEDTAPFHQDKGARGSNSRLLTFAAHGLDQRVEGGSVGAGVDDGGQAFLHRQSRLPVMVQGVRVEQKLEEAGNEALVQRCKAS